MSTVPSSETKLTDHVQPIIDFLAWARARGVTLGAWDGDGQQREVSSRDLVSDYAVEKFASRASHGGG